MHGKYHVYLYGFLGILSLVIAVFFGHDYFGENGETILNVIRCRNYFLWAFQKSKIMC